MARRRDPDRGVGHGKNDTGDGHGGQGRSWLVRWLSEAPVSSVVLVAAVFISLVSFASNLAGQRALDAILFDDRPAMVFSNMRTVSKIVRHGEPFIYEFDYTKRRECYPPKGSGEVTYRIWFDSGNGFDKYHVVDPATISYAGPELHHRLTNVTIPELPAGQYMMQWQVHFVCAGASKPQSWDGPMMPFEVVP